MKILSLFDGIGTGAQALKNVNVDIETYLASEIKSNAVEIALRNHSDVYRPLGDVNNINFNVLNDKYGQIDLLIGGSPCQDLSCAIHHGKGLEGNRSSLFFKFKEALEILKPKYFLLENVFSMTVSNREQITNHLGVNYVNINSKDFSPQERKRLYWTNIPIDKYTTDETQTLSNIIQYDTLKNRSGVNLLDYMLSQYDYDQFEKFNDKVIAASQISRARMSKAKDTNVNNNNVRLRYLVSKKDNTDKAFTLLTKAETGFVYNQKFYRYNNNELEALQNLPMGYIGNIGTNQAYHLVGDGWTCNVISHILKGVR